MAKLPPFKNPLYPKHPSSEIFRKYSSSLAAKDPIPYHRLQRTIDELAKKQITKDIKGIAHLQMRDTRCDDNTALLRAMSLAIEHLCPLVSVRVVCEDEMRAHGLGPIQYHYQYKLHQLFDKRLKDKFGVGVVEINISGDRKNVTRDLLEVFEKELNVNYVVANMEFEVDEVNFVNLLLRQGYKRDITVEAVNDTCIVPPGEILKKDGTAYKVYKPWFETWMKMIGSDPGLYLDVKIPEGKIKFVEIPEKFEPGPPLSLFKLSPEQKEALLTYEQTEADAQKALRKFVKKKLSEYDNDSRSSIINGLNSKLSPYLANGLISSRSVLREVMNSKEKSKSTEFIRQLAWRDFYKHIVAEFPYVCMGVGMKIDNLEWVNNESDLTDWQNGTTGLPIIDAIMKELNHTGYISNRARMITLSYLVKDLLVDWRYGEKYFMEKLIDGDFASNNGGWGFILLFGVNAQPWFRILNPWTQSARFDGEELEEKWDVEASQDKELHTKRRQRALDWIKQ